MSNHTDIFISHMADEAEVAIALQDMLQEVFLTTDVYVSSSPSSNPAGTSWYENMISKLREASAILIVCSERSIDRPWVNFETGAGIALQIPVIPLVHSGLRAGDVRIPFSLLQAKQANKSNELDDMVTVIADATGARRPKDASNLIADAVKRIRDFESSYSMIPEVIETFDASRDSQLQIGNRLANCRKKAVLSGVHFDISLSDWRVDYLKALERGIDIDIIVLDPKGSAVAVTAETYCMSESELQDECNNGLAKAMALKDEAMKQACKGGVQIYLMNTLPRARYYIFDPRERHGVLTFTAYIEDTRSSYSPTVAYRGDSSVALKYCDVCDGIRSKSTLL